MLKKGEVQPLKSAGASRLKHFIQCTNLSNTLTEKTSKEVSIPSAVMSSLLIQEAFHFGQVLEQAAFASVLGIPVL